MFLDWKRQYCENDYTTQSNLQIQCNSYETPMVFFKVLEQKYFTIHMETQKTLNSQSNLEERKMALEESTFQTIPQS